MDLKNLAQFLARANKETYANKSAPKVSSSRQASEDYHFENGDWKYHDTYFGARDFIGEEIVYFREKPVWGANYFGFIVDEARETREVYDFLRQALLQESAGSIPVRGPQEFSLGNAKYFFIANGSLESFSGEETILFDGKLAYRCLVHGGVIR